MTNDLSGAELRRYARHLTLPEFGLAGQARLKSAAVLCVGAGGLGAPALMYLAAAGFGRIGVVDPDVVDESNLQRQLLYGTSDLGQPKAEAAMRRLRDINPLITIEAYRARFTRENAESLLGGYDMLLDGADNFPTRYLCNDVAVLLRKPNVHGAIHRFEGQISVFAPHLGGPCYRCLFPEPPPPGTVPSCAEGGVLGVLPGLIGMLQATEAIKLATAVGEPLIGRLLHVDALTMRFREIKLRRDSLCARCGETPTLDELPDYAETCETREASGRDAGPRISVSDFATLRRSGVSYTLLDVREPVELTICRFPESIHIPLGQLADRLSEIPPARPLIVHCKAGPRGEKALALLEQHGFTDLQNLAGGIDAWAREIDSSMPTY
jgi:sulfur-carrier protein adenylyltransferase/sulfurtransferase